jgi:hypothetical protein
MEIKTTNFVVWFDSELTLEMIELRKIPIKYSRMSLTDSNNIAMASFSNEEEISAVYVQLFNLSHILSLPVELQLLL